MVDTMTRSRRAMVTADTVGTADTGATPTSPATCRTLIALVAGAAAAAAPAAAGRSPFETGCCSGGPRPRRREKTPPAAAISPTLGAARRAAVHWFASRCRASGFVAGPGTHGDVEVRAKSVGRSVACGAIRRGGRIIAPALRAGRVLSPMTAPKAAAHVRVRRSRPALLSAGQLAHCEALWVVRQESSSRFPPDSGRCRWSSSATWPAASKGWPTPSAQRRAVYWQAVRHSVTQPASVLTV